MAGMKLGNNLDFVRNQALGMKLENLASDPVSLAPADEGLIWVNTTNDRVLYADGSAVAQTLTNLVESVSGTGAITVGAVTAKNQAISIVAATTGVPGTMSAADKTKLDGVATAATANATDAQLRDLSLVTGTLAFGKGGTGGVAAPTAWGAPYGTGTALAYTVAGTTNQVLTATTGAAPAYKTLSADWAVDGATNHVFTAADDTKLTGITTAATANATDALLRDRSTHTGTQVHTTISDFDAGVATNRLDQLANPGADLVMDGYRVTMVGTPLSGQDAANKTYVDSVVSGLDIKDSVRCASTVTGGTYATTGGNLNSGTLTAAPSVVDGITLAVADRVLMKDHTNPAANGIWYVNIVGTGITGSWIRDDDFASSATVSSGAFTFVSEGTQEGTGWTLTTDNPVTVGGASGSALTFAQFSASAAYTAGNGLTLTGQGFDVVGTLNRVLVTADAVDISPNYVGQGSITTVGAIGAGSWAATDVAVAHGGTGASTALSARANLGATAKYVVSFGDGAAAGTVYTITHNLNTLDVTVELYENTGGAVVYADVKHTGTQTITVQCSAIVATNALRAVVIG